MWKHPLEFDVDDAVESEVLTKYPRECVYRVSSNTELFQFSHSLDRLQLHLFS